MDSHPRAAGEDLCLIRDGSSIASLNVVRRCTSGFLRLRFQLWRPAATTPDIWSVRFVMRAARHGRQPYLLKCESSSRSLPRSMKG